MFKKMLVQCIGICGCICLVSSRTAQAQSATDTLGLTIQQAEKIFLEKNLQLLAQHYNVEASKALIIQAKLWDNPILNTDQNVYSNNKYFEHGTNPDGSPYGQYYIQVQQLIKTAGKRGKQIQIARTNAEISEWQFKDVLRSLKYALHSDFYTVAKLLAMQQLYDEELQQLQKLSDGMNAQYKLGNIARKDLLRVHALQIGLQQDATENDKQLDDAEAELKSLLLVSGDTFIKAITESITIPSMPSVSALQLVDLAKQNNTTYQLQQLQLKYQQQNLSYQKALAVPDVTLGPNFDKNSNYTPNYVGLGISLPLPLLNRNQGNIKSARWQVKAEEANTQNAEVELSNNVMSAYNKLKYTLQLTSSMQQDFYDDYNKLYGNIVESFKNRQISMVEFIDYFDAYKDTRQKQLQQQLNLQLAKDELNMQVGTDVVE